MDGIGPLGRGCLWRVTAAIALAVTAVFTNADPAVAAHIQVSRIGKPILFSPNGFVGAGRSATLCEVAAKGDVLRFAWPIDGGATAPPTSAAVAVGLPGEPTRPAAFPLLGLGIALAVALAAAGLVRRRASRRQRLTWAVASVAMAGDRRGHDHRQSPGMSARWAVHADPGTHSLREDAA